MPTHDPWTRCPGTNCHRAYLLLPLQPHVVLDGCYTIDATCHFNRLVNVGPRTDEATSLHHAFEGFNIDLSLFQRRFAENSRLHWVESLLCWAGTLRSGRRRGRGLFVSIFTFATPCLVMPICLAAACERSSCRPCTYGPRSVIVTVTDWPVSRLVTLASVPSGSVRWAAVRAC